MRFWSNLTYILFMLFFLNCAKKVDCSLYPENQIPKSLEDALLILDCNTSNDFKLNFKAEEESKAVSMIHFGLGKKIRNDWQLWDAQNELYNEFKSVGILHPDDISSIILTSFHRTLNDLDIALEAQLQEYYIAYDQAKEAHEQNIKEEKAFFDTFKVGDYVKVVMSTGYENHKTAVGLLPRHYTKNSFNNCFVNGYITQKSSVQRTMHQSDEYFVTIKVDYICEFKEVIFKDSTLRKGDLLKYSMTYHNIEKIDPNTQKQIN